MLWKLNFLSHSRVQSNWDKTKAIYGDDELPTIELDGAEAKEHNPFVIYEPQVDSFTDAMPHY